MDVDALLIVPDSELQMTRHNTLLLVITSGIASQLQDLGSEVLENSSKVNWKRQRIPKSVLRSKYAVKLASARTRSTSTDALSVVTLL